MKRVIIPLVLLMCSIAFGETIRGRVTDKKTRQGIMAANLILVDQKNGAATDLDGFYRIDNVEPGTYQLKVSCMGYTSVVRNRVIIKPGMPTVINVELEEDIETLDAIVVKTSYFEKTEDAPLSARNMDKEEIIAQPGAAQDVQRAMQALPSVVSGMDFDNEVIVRGGNYGENLFILDNIEIPNPNHYAFQGSGGGIFSIINTDFIEEVDFLAGAFPARYGGKASSVLDITMREGQRDGFHYKFDQSLLYLGGYVEGPLPGAQGSYMISGHKSIFKVMDYLVDLPFVPDYGNVQGKFVWDFSPKTKLQLYGMYAADDLEFDFEEDDSSVDMEDVADLEYVSDQYTIGGTLKHVFDRGYLEVTPYRTVSNWRQAYSDTMGIERVHNYATELTNKLKADLTLFPTDKDEVVLGLDLSYSHFDDDVYFLADTIWYYDTTTGEELFPLDTGMTFTIDQKAGTWVYAGFAQYQHDFGKYLTTTAGLRVTHMDYTDRTYLAPRASATWHIDGKTDFSLAYGRHYQPPAWYMFASNGTANPLDYYRTDHYVAGISRLLMEDVKASVEVYYKQYDDMIITESDLTDDPLDESIDFINYMDGYSKGIEFFLQKKVKNGMWGTLSYSYSIARNNDPRQESCEPGEDCLYGEYPKNFDYGHVATAILGYQHDFGKDQWLKDTRKKWWYKALSWIPGVPTDANEYSARLRYMGGSPYTVPTYFPEVREWWVEEGTPYNSERTPYYARLDLRAQSRWYKKGFSISSYLELNNVFNRENLFDYMYNDDGTVEPMTQFPFMPSVGIIVEF